MTTKILIGTPCYGGSLHVNYFHAMRRAVPLLESQGVTVTFKTLAQESLISRARNTIVAEFLGRADHTHLLFIDADIGFEPELLPRLLAQQRPVVCAAYPMKGFDWAKVRDAAATAGEPGDLARAGLHFALNLQDEDAPAGVTAVENGFVRVSKAGTGMMLIERQVFDRLQAAYPGLRYSNDVAGYDNEFTRGNFWTFFDTLVHPGTRRYLSEDFAFCHRWTQGCGGEIWLDVQSTLSHYGGFSFKGSFLGAAQGA